MTPHQKQLVALRYWLHGAARLDPDYASELETMTFGLSYHQGVRKDGVTPEFSHQVAIASMTLGNLMALRQDDVVRLLAWSTVAQAGWVVVPLLSVSSFGARAAAGYLLPLDEYTDAWEDWDAFYDNAKEAGVGEDGKTYGIPMGTDTRALWYNKDLFAQAGLPVPWEPKTWQDVLDAEARVIRAFGSRAEIEALRADQPMPPSNRVDDFGGEQ